MIRRSVGQLLSRGWCQGYVGGVGLPVRKQHLDLHKIRYTEAKTVDLFNDTLTEKSVTCDQTQSESQLCLIDDRLLLVKDFIIGETTCLLSDDIIRGYCCDFDKMDNDTVARNKKVLDNVLANISIKEFYCGIEYNNRNSFSHDSRSSYRIDINSSNNIRTLIDEYYMGE